MKRSNSALRFATRTSAVILALFLASSAAWAAPKETNAPNQYSDAVHAYQEVDGPLLNVMGSSVGTASDHEVARMLEQYQPGSVFWLQTLGGAVTPQLNIVRVDPDNCEIRFIVGSTTGFDGGAVTIEDSEGNAIYAGSASTVTNATTLDVILTDTSNAIVEGDVVVDDSSSASQQIAEVYMTGNKYQRFGCRVARVKKIIERFNYCGGDWRNCNGKMMASGFKPWAHSPRDLAGTGTDITEQIHCDDDYDSVVDPGEMCAFDGAWLREVDDAEYNATLAFWPLGGFLTQFSGNTFDWSWLATQGYHANCYTGLTTVPPGGTCVVLDGGENLEGGEQGPDSWDGWEMGVDLSIPEARRFKRWQVIRVMESVGLSYASIDPKNGWHRITGVGGEKDDAYEAVPDSLAFRGPSRPESWDPDPGNGIPVATEGYFTDLHQSSKGALDVGDWDSQISLFMEELLADFRALGHGENDPEPWYLITNSRTYCCNSPNRGSIYSLALRSDPLYLGEATSKNQRIPTGTAFTPYSKAPPLPDPPVGGDPEIVFPADMTQLATRVAGEVPFGVSFDTDEITFTGALAGYDLDRGDCVVRWDFGDGVVTPWAISNRGATKDKDIGPQAGHVYRAVGTHTVQVDIHCLDPVGRPTDPYHNWATFDITATDPALTATEFECKESAGGLCATEAPGYSVVSSFSFQSGGMYCYTSGVHPGGGHAFNMSGHTNVRLGKCPGAATNPFVPGWGNSYPTTDDLSLYDLDIQMTAAGILVNNQTGVPHGIITNFTLSNIVQTQGGAITATAKNTLNGDIHRGNVYEDWNISNQTGNNGWNLFSTQFDTSYLGLNIADAKNPSACSNEGQIRHMGGTRNTIAHSFVGPTSDHSGGCAPTNPKPNITIRSCAEDGSSAQACKAAYGAGVNAGSEKIYIQDNQVHGYRSATVMTALNGSSQEYVRKELFYFGNLITIADITDTDSVQATNNCFNFGSTRGVVLLRNICNLTGHEQGRTKFSFLQWQVDNNTAGVPDPADEDRRNHQTALLYNTTWAQETPSAGNSEMICAQKAGCRGTDNPTVPDSVKSNAMWLQGTSNWLGATTYSYIEDLADNVELPSSGSNPWTTQPLERQGFDGFIPLAAGPLDAIVPDARKERAALVCADGLRAPLGVNWDGGAIQRNCVAW